MKKIIATLALASSLFGDIPEFPRDIVYTKEDMTVARVIYMEARGEGRIGMLCVADVISERMNNLSAYQVVSAPQQFDGINYNNVNWSDEQAQFCLGLAKRLLRGDDILPDHQFTHFFSGSEPYWARGQHKVKIGNHYFLRLRQ